MLGMQHPQTNSAQRTSIFFWVRLEPPITVLLGTGASQVWPSPEIYAAFAKAGIGLEPMSTGAAARTYNILIAEKRPIAAALVAVS